MAVRPTVLFVDDHEDLRTALGELLECCLNVSTIRAGGLDYLRERENDVLACRAAIIDINLGPTEPSGLEVFRWLKERGFRGKTIFLTGHAGNHPLVAEARQIEGVSVFEKPLGISELLNLLGGTAIEK